jgi:hypothetical protein
VSKISSSSVRSHGIVICKITSSRAAQSLRACPFYHLPAAGIRFVDLTLLSASTVKTSQSLFFTGTGNDGL